MRKDISKVICERYRTRSSESYHIERNTKENNQRLGFESWPFDGESASPFPFKEGIKKKFGAKYAYKGLSDSLGAVRGFLRKSVGRKWDEVYSELSKNIPKTKFLNQHVWEHIMSDVEIHTAWTDGRVCVSDERKRKYVPIEEYYHWGWRKKPHYYVHPISRLLLIVDHSALRKEEEKEAKRKEQDYWNHCREIRRTKTSVFYAVKIKNIWFEVEVRQRPPKVKVFYYEGDGNVHLDAQGKRMFYWDHPRVKEEYLGPDVKHTPHTNSQTYYALKRTMNHTELKRYKLI